MPSRVKPRSAGAGKLKHRIAFDQSALISDGYGNARGDWVEQFSVRAGVEARFGGEQVTAARLEGRQPVIITVRQSIKTKLIGTDWRARDVRLGTVYAIQSIADPNDDGHWFDMLCETGAAP